jgi:hypothetical protein
MTCVSHINWGDVPTWVQAIVTFLALAVAAGTFWWQTKVRADDLKFRRELDERQQEQDARDRTARARLFTAMATMGRGRTIGDGTSDRIISRWTLDYANRTDTVFRDVVMTLQPKRPGEAQTWVHEVGSMLPGEQTARHELECPAAYTENDWELLWEFIDIDGHRWHSSAAGVLSEVHESMGDVAVRASITGEAKVKRPPRPRIANRLR